MNKHYKGLIWTKHALSRMQKRGIKQSDAWATWRRPDQSRRSKTKGTWVYYKIYPSAHSGQDQKIEVVAKRNKKGEWVILSVWSRKVFEKKKNENKKKRNNWWTFISEALSKKLK